jgi:hypothetical protein
MKQYSLVPERYKERDPRALIYLYPTSLNVVAYAKRMQEFAFYQALEVAEDIAHKQGYILLPWSCIHWKRAKNFGADRKVKIGRNSYFLMKPSELTESEKTKLELYIYENLKKDVKIS